MNRRKDSIRAILFDFGDTLVNLSPSRYEIFIKVLSSAGLRLTAEAVKGAYRTVDLCNKYSSLSVRMEESKELFYERYNEELFRALGISSYFQKLYPRLRIAFHGKKEWKLVKDARHVLRGLNMRSIPLAIVANWDDGLEELSGRLGIKDFFLTIIASQDAGFEKPDPAFFRIAMEKLPLSESRGDILYVGNDYTLDVLGARAAGCVPVLIDREDNYPFADCARFSTLRRWFDSLMLSKEALINR
jgi:putative hydrolase of the HAD superfamily